MLRQPDNLVGNDFKQHRLAALDQQIINEYEALVNEWMSTIEAILTDAADERYSSSCCGGGGPVGGGGGNTFSDSNLVLQGFLKMHSTCRTFCAANLKLFARHSNECNLLCWTSSVTFSHFTTAGHFVQEPKSSSLDTSMPDFGKP